MATRRIAGTRRPVLDRSWNSPRAADPLLEQLADLSRPNGTQAAYHVLGAAGDDRRPRTEVPPTDLHRVHLVVGNVQRSSRSDEEHPPARHDHHTVVAGGDAGHHVEHLLLGLEAPDDAVEQRAGLGYTKPVGVRRGEGFLGSAAVGASVAKALLGLMHCTIVGLLGVSKNMLRFEDRVAIGGPRASHRLGGCVERLSPARRVWRACAHRLSEPRAMEHAGQARRACRLGSVIRSSVLAWRRTDRPDVGGETLTLAAGLATALASALGTNLAFLFKHRGAVAAPDVDMHHPLRSTVDLFRSRWFAIGWAIAVVAFLCHVAALALLPLSVAQAVLSGGFVLLAVLAERYFGFSLGRRQWVGVILVATALALLGITGQASGDDHAKFSVGAMILFEGAAVGIGLLLIFSHRMERVRVQEGVLLGAAAGLGFGISDVAIKAVSGDVIGGLPWVGLAVVAAVASFFASARSLQIGEGVAVIAVTSVAANMSAILAGVVVFGDPMGGDALEVVARTVAFIMVLGGAALMPAADAVGRREQAVPAT